MTRWEVNSMESRKPKVLIVDDVELNRAFLKDMLEEDYEIIEASDGVEAIDILKKCSNQLAVVLLDVVMPRMDGFEVLSLMNRYHWIEYIPVIMISAENSTDFVRSGYDSGAVDYISRPFDVNIVKKRVQNTIVLYGRQKILQNIVTEQVAEKEKNNTLMIDILSTIVEFRNGESGTHVLRIRIITELLLEAMTKKCQWCQLNPSEIAEISNASALHDVGKIVIPEEILNKPQRLTDEEFQIVKTHAAKGADMINNVHVNQTASMIRYTHDICRWHHERWDGKGYPDGLKGNEIPISAQAVSMADVYDALVSKRCYKPAYTPQEAVEMIKAGLCGTFNPELVACFLEIADTMEEQIKLRSKKEAQLFDVERISRDLIEKKGGAVSDRAIFMLEQERVKNQFLVALSDEIIFEYDMETDILDLSEKGAELLNTDIMIFDFLKSGKKLDFIHENDLENLILGIRASTVEKPIFQSQYALKFPQEKEKWHRFTVRTMWSGDAEPRRIGCIGKVESVHDKAVVRGKLELAERDSLTNLYNPATAKNMVEKIIEEDPQQFGAMILIDIDDFAKMNQIHGQVFADRVLKYVAVSIKKSIRRGDIAAKANNDKFMIFLKDVKEACHITHQVERIFKVITEGNKISSFTINLGAASYPTDGLTYEKLIEKAETALKVSKRTGKNQWQLYIEEQG